MTDDWQLAQGTVDARNEERRAANHTDQLFDPRTTERPRCPTCGTTAKNACEHDADIAAGIRDPYAPRPRGCLNRFGFMIPDDEPLPF